MCAGDPFVDQIVVNIVRESLQLRVCTCSELQFISQVQVGRMTTTMIDDWKQFAQELWGINIATWEPIPERDGTLPSPLDYDIMQDGLVELEGGQRQMVLQCLSCYQVGLRTKHLPRFR